MSDNQADAALLETPTLSGPEIPGADVDEHGTFTYEKNGTEVCDRLPIEFPIAPLFEEAQPIDWLWPQRIPLGMVTFLEGAGSAGKTFVVLDMAARVTRGAPWPGRLAGPHQAGDVLLVCGDSDGWARVVLPRLVSAGADLSRIARSELVQSHDPVVASHSPKKADTWRRLSLPHDLPMLEFNIRFRPETRLVVIDSLSAYCAGDREFRETLRQLDEIAERRNVAIVVTARPAKQQSRCAAPGAADRRAETVRSVFRILVDPEDEKLRHLAPVRTSFCAEPEWLPFQIGPQRAVGGGAVAWGPPAEAAPESAAPPSPARERAALRQEVMIWLRTILAERDMLARTVTAAAKQLGYSEATLRRARAALKVRMYWGPGGTCTEGWWTLRPEGEGPDIPPDSVLNEPAVLNRMQNGEVPLKQSDGDAKEVPERVPDVCAGVAPDDRPSRTGRRDTGTVRNSPRRRDAGNRALSITDIPDAIWERFRRPFLAAILETATDAADGDAAPVRRSHRASNGEGPANGEQGSKGRRRKPKPK
jgi:hypothetical protein